MLSPAPSRPAAPRFLQRTIPANAASPILDPAPARARTGSVKAVVCWATFGAAWVHGYEEAGTEELPDFRTLLPKDENAETPW